MRRCEAYTIVLSHVMQKCHGGGETNSTSEKKGSAASRACARGSDGDYKMSFRKIFTLLIRQ